MNRAEILALKPGRELDEAIAVSKGHKPIVGTIGCYTGDMNNAMKLVEEMPMPLAFWKRYKNIPEQVLGQSENEPNVVGWYVVWCDDYECIAYTDANCDCPDGEDVWAETLPEAIGKAYLLGFVDWEKVVI